MLNGCMWVTGLRGDEWALHPAVGGEFFDFNIGIGDLLEN